MPTRKSNLQSLLEGGQPTTGSGLPLPGAKEPYSSNGSFVNNSVPVNGQTGIISGQPESTSGQPVPTCGQSVSTGSVPLPANRQSVPARGNSVPVSDGNNTLLDQLESFNQHLSRKDFNFLFRLIDFLL